MAQAFACRVRHVCFSVLFAYSLTSCSSSFQNSSTDSSTSRTVSSAKSMSPTIRIGTYNVENLWDGIESNTTGSYEQYSSLTSNWYESRAYLKKAINTAHAISLAGSPEILALQEIESGKNESEALELLKPHLKKLGYKYFELGKQQNSKPTFITTAVISKYPIIKNSSVLTFGDSSSRDPQVVDVNINGVVVKIYVNHWKSKRKSFPGENTEEQRIATARLVASDIEKVRKNQPAADIIVLGDFNSQYNESQITQASTGINTILKSTGNALEMLKTKSPSTLYNLWYERPAEKRCSYSYQGELQCIDNILVSDGLFDNSGLRFVPGSVEVIGRDGGQAQSELLNADGTSFRWQVRMEFKNGKPYYRHIGTGFSDHLPVVASFFVQSVKDHPKKIAWDNPSAVDEAEAAAYPVEHPNCRSDSETDINSIDVENPSVWFQCYRASEDHGFEIKKSADHHIFIIVSGKSLGVALTDTNDESGKNFLKASVGRWVESINGRLGWNRGLRTLFIDDVDSVKLSPQ